MICIMTAMREEFSSIYELLDVKNEKTDKGILCVEGEYQGKQFLLVRSVQGKINAARTTQFIIDHYDINAIINVGIAGSVSDAKIGDVVIGEEYIQHDYDMTCDGYPIGQMSSTLRGIFYPDEALLRKAVSCLNARLGVVATGDTFVVQREKKFEEIQASCVEMEAAAIAYVCQECEVPFLAIKCISDIVGETDKTAFIGALDCVLDALRTATGQLLSAL